MRTVGNIYPTSYPMPADSVDTALYPISTPTALVATIPTGVLRVYRLVCDVMSSQTMSTVQYSTVHHKNLFPRVICFEDKSDAALLPQLI